MSTRFAISIGINDYPDRSDLSFCAKDAEDISVTFTSFCNLEEENIRLVTSDLKRPLTNPWNDFCAIIEDLKYKFLPGKDDIFFYFSGHGQDADQTTVIFKHDIKTISDIVMKLDELSPRTKVLFFDSCHSGAGMVEVEKSAIQFSQAIKASSGYSILCACSKDQSAKETAKLRNGRFTSFLMSVIADLQSYNRDGYLDINTLFGKTNLFFVDNPHYNQNPYLQIRSVGSYPLATTFRDENFYVRFDVSNPNEYDWTDLVTSLNVYLSTTQRVKGEFIRLVNEFVSNMSDPLKGNAERINIEVTKHRVTLSDNGVFFDLFAPPQEIQGRGGVITAERFRIDLSENFTYHAETIGGINYYVFEFNVLSQAAMCSLRMSFDDVRGYYKENFIIEDECPFFTIRFERYAMYISFGYMYVEKFVKIAQKFQKQIIMEIVEDDWIIPHVIDAIKMYDAKDWIVIKLYKE